MTSPTPVATAAAAAPLPLEGVRILSLALNLPGPAALVRCRDMGAQCLKVDPPSGDPMAAYSAQAEAWLGQGLRTRVLDLKAEAGRAELDAELADTDVLLTSFRPSALDRLGLSWPALHGRFPRLSHVALVGGHGPQAEVPSHDLCHVSGQGLVQGLALPPTLFADMAAALLLTEAVLQAVLCARGAGRGTQRTVALGDAAAWLALPRRWGLMGPGELLGGGHAGYRVYPCRDGRVAVAALEPRFAQALCAEAGLDGGAGEDAGAGAGAGAGACDATAVVRDPMASPRAHEALAAFFSRLDRADIDLLARSRGLPLVTMPA